MCPITLIILNIQFPKNIQVSWTSTIWSQAPSDCVNMIKNEEVKSQIDSSDLGMQAVNLFIVYVMFPKKSQILNKTKTKTKPKSDQKNQRNKKINKNSFFFIPSLTRLIA